MTTSSSNSWLNHHLPLEFGSHFDSSSSGDPNLKAEHALSSASVIMEDKAKTLPNKIDDKVSFENVVEPKTATNEPKKVNTSIVDKDKHIPLQILKNLEGKICKICKSLLY